MPRKKLPEDAIIGKRRFVCNLGRKERPNTTVYWKVRFLENFDPADIIKPTEQTRASLWHKEPVTSTGSRLSLEPVAPDGNKILRTSDYSDKLEPYILEYVYPASEVSPYTTTELYIAARNTFELLNAWNDERMPYNAGTAAARLGVAPTCVIEHLKYILEQRQLPNGVLEFMGGGIENNAIIPTTLQEMMLQSYEGIIRLFPNWDKTHFASFHNWRAYGAFLRR